MPKHILRLVLLIVVFLAAAVAAKSYFTAPSFYRYGHYRADSVPVIAGMAPSYQTPKACQSCHATRLTEWSASAHKTVICEVCHGAAAGHPQSLQLTIPTDTQKLCAQCHEKIAGRPVSSIRQIDAREHFPAATQCIACHNPHEPKIAPPTLNTVADQKAAAASTAGCASCHGIQGVAVNPVWPNLAGQNAAYIARSLGAFKTGERKNELMGPMAQALPDEDVLKIARYYSSLSCRSGATATDKATRERVAAGERLAAQQCLACHGKAGRPVNTAWPSLAGQNADYLAAALAAFKSGERPDPFMSPVASKLTDTEMGDLGAYFASLACSNDSHKGIAR